jgi:hypothetical protein
MDAVREQIIEVIDQLTPEQQTQLLALARNMRDRPPVQGVPGEVWLAAKDRFNFSPDYIDIMMKDIEDECENIDWASWE